MNARRALRWLALALTAAAAFGIVTVSASQHEEDEEKSVGSERAQEAPMVHLGSLRVAVDPETGELRPLTKQEAARLANEMRKLFKPRDIGEPTLRPDGAMSAIVAPNVLRFEVATVQDDGTVSLDCTDGTEDAIEHLTHLAVAPVPRARDIK